MIVMINAARRKKVTIYFTCSLILLLSNWMFFILKSIPIVVMKVGEKESFA